MILITRPIEKAEKTKHSLTMMGYASIIHPLTVIKHIDFNIADENYDAAIITSEAAAIAVKDSKLIKNIAKFIVGKSSETYFHNNVIAVTQDGTELFTEITNLMPPKRQKLLYICGNFIANNLDIKLAEAGYTIRKTRVYNVEENTKTIDLTANSIESVLLYSPKAAEIFTKQYREQCANISAYCLSKNIAYKLNGCKFRSIKVARTPTEESLLELLKDKR